jgi:hypothetical protein
MPIDDGLKFSGKVSAGEFEDHSTKLGSQRKV